MFSCLLKRVLPFTLTFMLGAFIGGLFKTHRAGPAMWTWEKAAPLLGHEGPFGYGYGHSCRMYRRYLVAETKPLLVHFKPDAHWPRELPYVPSYVATARVTFGADGKVQQVEHLNDVELLSHGAEGTIISSRVDALIWGAAEHAARQIQFEPEMVNGLPISVTKVVEIHFMAD